MANQARVPGEAHHDLAGGVVMGFWVLALVVLSIAVAVVALVALTGTLH